MKNKIYKKNELGITEYIYDIPDYVKNQYYIMVGYPLVDPSSLYDILPAYTTERFIPKILKELEIVKSTGEIKRNHPDLFISLPESYLGFFSITLGHYMRTWETSFITFIVGPSVDLESQKH